MKVLKATITFAYLSAPTLSNINDTRFKKEEAEKKDQQSENKWSIIPLRPELSDIPMFKHRHRRNVSKSKNPKS